MSGRHPFLGEGAILLAAAIAAAALSNRIGPSERRLAWVRDYPEALTVPKNSSPAPAPRSAPPSPAAPVPESVAAAVPRAKPEPAAPARQPAAKGPRASTNTSPEPAPAAASSADEFAPHPQTPWKEIAPEQARALFDRGALFLDARRTSVYREGHIRGARSIAVWEADADDKVKAFYEEGHDPKAPIVVYCSGGDCEDSHQLAQKLYGAGFDAVFVYRDGFPDWQRRGWPVETGEAR